jgi:hypothetical protein
MTLKDGAFHPKAYAEAEAIRKLQNPCLSAVLGMFLEIIEDLLAGRRQLESDFRAIPIRFGGCELFSRGVCIWRCNQGIAVTIGRLRGRRVVLAIEVFSDVADEAVNETAAHAATVRAAGRISDI